MDHLKIRQLFQNYFEKRNHHWSKSASLIPHNDPSLLFVNAGMNQFKNIFLGIESTDHKNIVSIQKCLRAGGKHNDLEQVGFSPYHHTFFEMMGNFSFGGYFKEEACRLSWKFLTEELGLPKEKLTISVFEKDQESVEIWNKKINIPKERISLYGEDDNFWRMGTQGPCGPCSEIFYSPDGKESSKMEIWNLVFMETNETVDGRKTPLKVKCIDTGMGLERLVQILQNKSSNFETDLFLPIIERSARFLKVKYDPQNSNHTMNTPLRILSDHIKSGVFLMSDGLIPSNEGKGYVLRRILRRAIYSISLISNQRSFLKEASNAVFDIYASSYPEILPMKQQIQKHLDAEEDKFFNTLNQGKIKLEKIFHELKKTKGDVLDAQKSFQLYDTYGFPLDLIIRICDSHNIKVDQEGFKKIMQESKSKNKELSQFKSQIKAFPDVPSSISKTKFVGYNKLQTSAKVLILFDKNNIVQKELKAPTEGLVIFNSTPCYPEGGGQVGDQGMITNKSSSLVAQVKDCQNINSYLFHQIEVKEGSIKQGDSYTVQVNHDHRTQTAIHHSATHLLHSALRKVLGAHTKQQGSLVTSSRLRFDFSCEQSLTEEQSNQIEDLVNSQIQEENSVSTDNMSYRKALQQGALSFFDKPSSKDVRVLTMGSFSKELCGGTHVNNTREIKYFKILSENSVSSGVRRIEAVCGSRALNLITNLGRENIKTRKLLQLPTANLQSSDLLIEEIEKQQNLVKKLKKSKISVTIPSDLSIEKFKFDSQVIAFHCRNHDIEDHQELLELSDQIKSKNPNFLGVLVGKAQDESTPIVVAVPKILASKLPARSFITSLGGKGGGPATFAKGALDKNFSIHSLRKEILKLLHSHNLAEELQS